MGTMSIPARIEFSSRLMPKLLLIMPTLVTMTLGSGFQLARKLGNLAAELSATTAGCVASYIVVGVMAVIALGLLEPANVAVLFEMRKPEPERGADRPADEGLHLHRRDHRADADRDARDHDQDRERLTVEAAHAGGAAGCPPIQQIAVAILVLIVVGGIYTAAHLPRHVPQGPTIALLAAAAVLLAVNVRAARRGSRTSPGALPARRRLGARGLRGDRRACSSTSSSTTTRAAPSC